MDLLFDNASNDIYVSAGEVQWVSGIDAIKQHLEFRLRSFLGEWFLDNRIGVPYFQDIFKKNPDLTILNSIYTKAILDTPGVLSIGKLNFDLDSSRQLSVSFEAETTSGVLNFLDYVGV